MLCSTKNYNGGNSTWTPGIFLYIYAVLHFRSVISIELRGIAKMYKCIILEILLKNTYIHIHITTYRVVNIIAVVQAHNRRLCSAFTTFSMTAFKSSWAITHIASHNIYRYTLYIINIMQKMCTTRRWLRYIFIRWWHALQISGSIYIYIRNMHTCACLTYTTFRCLSRILRSMDSMFDTMFVFLFCFNHHRRERCPAAYIRDGVANRLHRDNIII